MRKPVSELSNVLWTVCACHIKTSRWSQVQTRCRPGVDNAADQAKYHAVAWSLASSTAWSTLGLHMVCTWSAPLSTNWPAFDTYTLNILDMSIASYESHSQYALVFLHRAFLCLCHKTVLQCFRNRIRTWTIANTMYELEANIHLNFQHTFCELDSQRAPVKFQTQTKTIECAFRMEAKVGNCRAGAQRCTRIQISAQFIARMHHLCMHALCCACRTCLHVLCNAHIHSWTFMSACNQHIKFNVWLVFISCAWKVKCILRIGIIKARSEHLKCSLWLALDVYDSWRPIGGCRPGGSGVDQVQTKWRPGGERAQVGPPFASSPLGLHLVHTWSANWIPTAVDHRHRQHHKSLRSSSSSSSS